jgi:hypothetical protein
MIHFSAQRTPTAHWIAKHHKESGPVRSGFDGAAEGSQTGAAQLLFHELGEERIP